MTSDQKDFLLKEYDKLSSEAGKLLEETCSREKYSLTIISLVAAWIYTNSKGIDAHEIGSVTKLVSFIPLVITTLYGISVLLIHKNIRWIGNYLAELEGRFIEDLKDSKGRPQGWERYFNNQNRESHFVKWTWIFWLLQISIGFALVIQSYKLS